MKRSNIDARLLVATLTTVTLVTLNGVTLAATMGDSPDAIRAETAATRNAPAKHQQETAITHSPLTLLVQSPSGSTVRLTYIQDDGWMFDDRDASLEQTEGRVTPAVASQQKKGAIANRPLTVFIDGPSGYTYVWIRDQGWKFVGRITDQIK
ncbi:MULTISPECIES: hypothetical protein [unclassified Paraburkholderia]|uniref:hypothetical protein n=1 Tax=unclassified Paraburkholderia TaxID=2615204 RepID=UPI00161DFF90|nr:MULTISPECIES: hypothetical protein [unclassified Paraburkholderia]MBB5444786.1 hypothetical protein [Paraburkholderia sp. WSM4177]MBB5483718.1 hypothetical protein [Paraburkholderia sp. WSM4180]